ncbi:MAG: 3-methyladenine DNA glycosylase [Bogoriella megaspora]|nr:MAG: 3-methyladenine DNA glycosylase [Bogoriella megaspora]
MSLRRSTRVQSLTTRDGGANETVTSTNSTTTTTTTTKSTKKTAIKTKKTKASMPPPSEPASASQGTNIATAPGPSTPRKRRKINDDPSTPTKPPPFTPTPSAIGLMTDSSPLPAARAPYSTGDIDDATPPPPATPRPVEPHLTNAPLSTPGGSRVVAYPSRSAFNSGLSLSQSADLPVPTTTTATLLQEACEHLCKVDPRLRKVVERHHCRIFDPEGLAEEVDPFRSLASGIMAQQVSGAAAKSIKNKFIALFHPSDSTDPPSFPAPAVVAATNIATLRTAGLSQRKAEYIQGLAEKFASGELSAQMLVRASDEEVLEKLTAVRGLGRWSVEMFACFALKRMDVFSTGDLGVQRGMAAWMGRDVSKLKAKGKGGKWKYMSEQEMLDLSAQFAPYRSLFMWYMWRIEDVNLDAIEGA